MTLQWDCIIVGAGSAGCVLANRLSADPKKQVLLIEAGGSDRNPLQRIPMAGVLLNYGHERRDWHYRTQPDPSRHNRVEPWPRGRLLGGSSSLNGMIYVRGAKEDFDGWADLGNHGWSYEDVLPVFQSLEDHEFAHTTNPHREQYGGAGSLKIRQLRGVHPLASAFVSAWGELGVAENSHYNADVQDGSCVLSATHSGRVRYSSAQAFLQPVRHRSNLHILTNTLATRVLLEGKKAVGVSVMRAGEQTERTVHADHIVLCGGAINSPQLLLLSGIGPAEHLRQLSIPVHHDLPGVGKNLQDHPLCFVIARVNVRTVTASWLSAIRDGIDWLLFGKGTWTFAGCQALAFVRTKPELPHPDAQVHIMPFGMGRSDKNRVRFVERCITLLANVSRVGSRGEIRLKSRNPRDAPAIFPNMLSDERDVQTLTAAGRLCRQLLKTRSLAPYVEEESAPGLRVQTDQEWEDYIRETTWSGAHQCGTCKMGLDTLAVVDPELRVRGIERLRIADASVMPAILSGNTNASCMMIGARAAELISRALPERIFPRTR